MEKEFDLCRLPDVVANVYCFGTGVVAESIPDSALEHAKVKVGKRLGLDVEHIYYRGIQIANDAALQRLMLFWKRGSLVRLRNAYDSSLRKELSDAILNSHSTDGVPESVSFHKVWELSRHPLLANQVCLDFTPLAARAFSGPPVAAALALACLGSFASDVDITPVFQQYRVDQALGSAQLVKLLSESSDEMLHDHAARCIAALCQYQRGRRMVLRQGLSGTIEALLRSPYATARSTTLQFMVGLAHDSPKFVVRLISEFVGLDVLARASISGDARDAQAVASLLQICLQIGNSSSDTPFAASKGLVLVASFLWATAHEHAAADAAGTVEGTGGGLSRRDQLLIMHQVVSIVWASSPYMSSDNQADFSAAEQFLRMLPFTVKQCAVIDASDRADRAVAQRKVGIATNGLACMAHLLRIPHFLNSVQQIECVTAALKALSRALPERPVARRFQTWHMLVDGEQKMEQLQRQPVAPGDAPSYKSFWVVNGASNRQLESACAVLASVASTGGLPACQLLWEHGTLDYLCKVLSLFALRTDQLFGDGLKYCIDGDVIEISERERQVRAEARERAKQARLRNRDGSDDETAPTPRVQLTDAELEEMRVEALGKRQQRLYPVNFVIAQQVEELTPLIGDTRTLVRHAAGAAMWMCINSQWLERGVKSFQSVYLSGSEFVAPLLPPVFHTVPDDLVRKPSQPSAQEVSELLTIMSTKFRLFVRRQKAPVVGAGSPQPKRMNRFAGVRQRFSRGASEQPVEKPKLGGIWKSSRSESAEPKAPQQRATALSTANLFDGSKVLNEQVPILVKLLQHRDPVVLLHVSAALWALARDKRIRGDLAALGCIDLLAVRCRMLMNRFIDSVSDTFDAQTLFGDPLFDDGLRAISKSPCDALVTIIVRESNSTARKISFMCAFINCALTNAALCVNIVQEYQLGCLILLCSSAPDNVDTAKRNTLIGSLIAGILSFSAPQRVVRFERVQYLSLVLLDRLYIIVADKAAPDEEFVRLNMALLLWLFAANPAHDTDGRVLAAEVLQRVLKPLPAVAGTGGMLHGLQMRLTARLQSLVRKQLVESFGRYPIIKLALALLYSDSVRCLVVCALQGCASPCIVRIPCIQPVRHRFVNLFVLCCRDQLACQVQGGQILLMTASNTASKLLTLRNGGSKRIAKLLEELWNATRTEQLNAGVIQPVRAAGPLTASQRLQHAMEIFCNLLMNLSVEFRNQIAICSSCLETLVHIAELTPNEKLHDLAVCTIHNLQRNSANRDRFYAIELKMKSKLWQQAKVTYDTLHGAQRDGDEQGKSTTEPGADLSSPSWHTITIAEESSMLHDEDDVTAAKAKFMAWVQRIGAAKPQLNFASNKLPDGRPKVTSASSVESLQSFGFCESASGNPASTSQDAFAAKTGSPKESALLVQPETHWLTPDFDTNALTQGQVCTPSQYEAPVTMTYACALALQKSGHVSAIQHEPTQAEYRDGLRLGIRRAHSTAQQRPVLDSEQQKRKKERHRKREAKRRQKLSSAVASELGSLGGSSVASSRLSTLARAGEMHTSCTTINLPYDLPISAHPQPQPIDPNELRLRFIVHQYNDAPSRRRRIQHPRPTLRAISGDVNASELPGIPPDALSPAVILQKQGNLDHDFQLPVPGDSASFHPRLDFSAPRLGRLLMTPMSTVWSSNPHAKTALDVTTSLTLALSSNPQTDEDCFGFGASVLTAPPQQVGQSVKSMQAERQRPDWRWNVQINEKTHVAPPARAQTSHGQRPVGNSDDRPTTVGPVSTDVHDSDDADPRAAVRLSLGPGTERYKVRFRENGDDVFLPEDTDGPGLQGIIAARRAARMFKKQIGLNPSTTDAQRRRVLMSVPQVRKPRGPAQQGATISAGMINIIGKFRAVLKRVRLEKRGLKPVRRRRSSMADSQLGKSKKDTQLSKWRRLHHGSNGDEDEWSAVAGYKGYMNTAIAATVASKQISSNGLQQRPHKHELSHAQPRRRRAHSSSEEESPRRVRRQAPTDEIAHPVVVAANGLPAPVRPHKLLNVPESDHSALRDTFAAVRKLLVELTRFDQHGDRQLVDKGEAILKALRAQAIKNSHSLPEALAAERLELLSSIDDVLRSCSEVAVPSQTQSLEQSTEVLDSKVLSSMQDAQQLRNSRTNRPLAVSIPAHELKDAELWQDREFGRPELTWMIKQVSAKYERGQGHKRAAVIAKQEADRMVALAKQRRRELVYDKVPISVFRFKHTPGSKVYQDLFPGASNEEGPPSHFYYQQDEYYELVPKFSFRPPPDPVHLNDIFHAQYPATIEPSTIFAVDLPQIQQPRPPVPLIPSYHNLPVVDHQCEGTNCKFFGVLPDLHIHLSVTELLPSYVERPRSWSPANSAFKNRKGGLYDDEASMTAAFDSDWQQLSSSMRFYRLLKNHGGSGDERADKLRAVVLRYLQPIWTAFLRWASITPPPTSGILGFSSVTELKAAMDSRGVASDLEGSDDGESASPTSTLHMVSRAAVPMDVLALTTKAWVTMATELRLTEKGSKYADVHHMKEMFAEAAYKLEEGGGMKHVAKRKPIKRRLGRIEFVDALLRTSVARFIRIRATSSIVEAMDMLMDNSLAQQVNARSLFLPHVFRVRRLYKTAVERVLHRYLRPLEKIFDHYCHIDIPNKGPETNFFTITGYLSIAQWMVFVTDSKLLVRGFTQRDARMCFAYSKPFRAYDSAAPVDAERAVRLEFPDFLEALARVADCRSTPLMSHIISTVELQREREDAMFNDDLKVLHNDEGAQLLLGSENDAETHSDGASQRSQRLDSEAASSFADGKPDIAPEGTAPEGTTDSWALTAVDVNDELSREPKGRQTQRYPTMVTILQFLTLIRKSEAEGAAGVPWDPSMVPTVKAEPDENMDEYERAAKELAEAKARRKATTRCRYVHRRPSATWAHPQKYTRPLGEKLLFTVLEIMSQLAGISVPLRPEVPGRYIDGVGPLGRPMRAADERVGDYFDSEAICGVHPLHEPWRPLSGSATAEHPAPLLKPVAVPAGQKRGGILSEEARTTTSKGFQALQRAALRVAQPKEQTPREVILGWPDFKLSSSPDV